MPYLYLLSEDDFDDQTLVYLLETLRPGQVEPIARKYRRGGGIGAVRKALPLVMSDIRRSGHVDDTYLLVAIDNDRALEHADPHEKKPHTRDEGCRHCALEEILHQGTPDGQPVPAAIAIPVQMIESWLLLIAQPERNEWELPVCARRDQVSARDFYGPNPPPQLKDLFRDAVESSGMSREDFVLDRIVHVDVDDLSGRSPSFARFRKDVSAWDER